MSRRLPPLNALRAFEAAARHLSFTKAADELAVTQAAISHQVKALEGQLGVALFRRFNRRLALTEAGRDYLPSLSQAFDLMDSATRNLRRDRGRPPLKVSTLPSFAAKWLLPRLNRFRERHPEIDVMVSAKSEMSDFEREEIDVGIRFGRGRYPGLAVEFLMPDAKFPACSPRLLAGRHPLKRPEDLRHHVLLQDTVHGGLIDVGWPEWLEIARVSGIDGARGPGFDDSAMCVAAAVAGQGVVLTRASIAGDDIAAGLLVKPFGPEVATGYSYYLVTRPEASDDTRVQAFRDWLRAEVAASAAP